MNLARTDRQSEKYYELEQSFIFIYIYFLFLLKAINDVAC